MVVLLIGKMGWVFDKLLTCWEVEVWPVWPEKNRQMSIRVAKNELTRKMIDFHNFTKIAQECGRLGQINCGQSYKKLSKVQ